MSYNIFMLCHYGVTVAPYMSNNITYNGGSNVLLNDNLDMSFMDVKQAICHELE